MPSVTKMKPRKKIPAAEWDVRVDLAACYRLVAQYGMTDLALTHISARVPGNSNHFLLNPYGLLFDEITASSLVKIDLDGNPVEESDYEVNRAGYVIHSAVLAGRPELNCVLHTHTIAGMAVSAQAEGLLPLAQCSMRFHNRLAYHDYEGISLDTDERSRLQTSLGDKYAMMLRNHGLLVAGRTVPEAWSLNWALERACQVQVAARSGDAKLSPAGAEVAEHTAQQLWRGNEPAGQREWPSLLRQLDRIDPSYKQ
jgi:ribulose-5-phosphate 4-epimerase/fuculose-1-phosphate aldolase